MDISLKLQVSLSKKPDLSPAFICLFLLGHKVGDNHQYCYDS